MGTVGLKAGAHSITAVVGDRLRWAEAGKRAWGGLGARPRGLSGRAGSEIEEKKVSAANNRQQLGARALAWGGA